MTTTTYRLQSNEGVYAPGILRWAINGAKFKNDRQKLAKVIADGWGVPMATAMLLVCGQLPYTVEGETVVFSDARPVA